METEDKENMGARPSTRGLQQHKSAAAAGEGSEDTVMLSNSDRLRQRLQNMQRRGRPAARAADDGEATVKLPGSADSGTGTGTPTPSMSPAQSQKLLRSLSDIGVDQWNQLLAEQLSAEPATWLSFIQQAEAHVTGEHSAQTPKLDPSSVLRLYRIATESLPKTLYRTWAPYEKLWVQYASWQLKYTEKREAKQTLKYLFAEGLGGSIGTLYTLMAEVETKPGGAANRKVESVLRKGIAKCPASEHAAIHAAWVTLLGVPYVAGDDSSDSTDTIGQDECTETVRVGRTAVAPVAEETVKLTKTRSRERQDGQSAANKATEEVDMDAPTIRLPQKTEAEMTDDADAPTILLGKIKGRKSTATASTSSSGSRARAKPAARPMRRLGLGGAKATRVQKASDQVGSAKKSAEAVEQAPTEESVPAVAFDRLSLGPIEESHGRSSNGSCNSTATEDSIVKASPVDLSGDGRADAVGYDTNGDGHVDSLDTTGDGLIDARVVPVPEEDATVTTSQEQKEVRKQEDLEKRNALLQTIECVSTESKEMVTIEGRQYRKLCVVGRGGSCKVYKVIGPDGSILALKRIRVSSEDGFEQFVNEIDLLFKLKGKDNIIQLMDQSVNRKHGMVYMVFEYGEIDLHKLLQKQAGKPIKDNFIRLYWQQMLEAVHTIHEQRIVHSDLKPANFLIVEGTLKLIDFGIAMAIEGNDTTNIVRDAQIGTINYMSPEALSPPETENEFKLSRKSDIWSLGCILYQMVFGRTPFHHLSNIMSKMRAITDPNYNIKFPECKDAHLVETLEACMQRDLSTRPGIPELLEHPYVTGSFTDHPAKTEVDTGAGGSKSTSNLTLQAILAQVAAAGSDGQDAAAMAQMLLSKLQNGEDVTGEFKASSEAGESTDSTRGSSEARSAAPASDASSGSRAPPPPPPPPNQSADRALQSKPKLPAAKANLPSAEMGDLHAEIRNGAGRLKPVASRPAPLERQESDVDVLFQKLQAVRKAAGNSQEETVTMDFSADVDDTGGW